MQHQLDDYTESDLLAALGSPFHTDFTEAQLINAYLHKTNNTREALLELGRVIPYH